MEDSNKRELSIAFVVRTNLDRALEGKPLVAPAANVQVVGHPDPNAHEGIKAYALKQTAGLNT